jgi:sulfite reductase (ferredoxin)
VRNITVSVDSGVAPDEVFDVSPYAFALTSRLISEPDSWLLPRKYKIAFSNSPQDTARAAVNDLGFIAKIQQGVKGFEVYVAGGMGTNPQVGHRLHEFVPASEVYVIAEAVKHLFDKHGNRKNRYAARLRFLWNTLGETRFRELYQQEVDALLQKKVDPLQLSESPALPPTPEIAPATDSSPEFVLWRKRYVTGQKQPGLSSVLVPIFLGNLKTDDALALADFLAPFGSDSLRASIDQNLWFRNIPETLLGNVHALVNRITNLASEPRFLGSAVACTGASTCKLGICLPRGALAAVVKILKASKLDLDRAADLRMNLSGCPNTCGDHMIADLGFFGKVARKNQIPYPAYGIVVGGTLANGKARLAEPAGEVSAHDLPLFVTDLLRDYLESQPRFASFADYLEKTGKPFIHTWCAQHREIPDFDTDKNYYYDWTATEVFSLAGRGVGECSAGLFDLIDFDLKRIKELRNELPALADRQRVETLYQIILSAARMLLITRAVEPRSEAEVFLQFRHHFIEAGLVEAKYLPLVELALQKDLPGIEVCAEAVLLLAQDMEALYGKMDNSLHFPGELPGSPTKVPVIEKPKAGPVASKDFRGVACPMNFVKTKLVLESLTAGQRLQILLDDGAPIQNVPRSVSAEGHKIIDQHKEEKHWVVLIEKQ